MLCTKRWGVCTVTIFSHLILLNSVAASVRFILILRFHRPKLNNIVIDRDSCGDFIKKYY